jgi:hypothetical protein
MLDGESDMLDDAILSFVLLSFDRRRFAIYFQVGGLDDPPISRRQKRIFGFEMLIETVSRISDI